MTISVSSLPQGWAETLRGIKPGAVPQIFENLARDISLDVRGKVTPDEVVEMVAEAKRASTGVSVTDTAMLARIDTM